MREIKFRAWNKDRKIICKVNDIYDGEYEPDKLEFDIYDDKTGYQNYHLTREIDGIEVMQFTGLLDKNKVEIWEGDILKYYNDLHVIHWDEHIAGFSWRTCSMDNYLMFRKFVAENCEVVGNIYENDELLEAIK